MAFTVPTFNLAVDIYNGPWLTMSLRLSVMGNLTPGRRVQQQFLTDFVPEGLVGTLEMGLLLPAGTDVRDAFQGFPPDVFEVPAGSGRWYQLTCWDDVAKGFANEYRFVVLSKIGNFVSSVKYPGLFWPTPTP